MHSLILKEGNLPNFYVDRGFSTVEKTKPDNEIASSNSADQENESENKEITEKKVGIFYFWWNKNNLMKRLKQEKEGRDDVE